MTRNPAANREQFRPDDHPNDHFILSTVVGSYPKPKWLNRARDLHHGELEVSAADRASDEPRGGFDIDVDFDEENWQEAKDDASRLITNEHERAEVTA